jgi:hypothetical protein
MFELPDIKKGYDFSGYLPFKIVCFFIKHRWKYYQGVAPARICLRCARYEWEKVEDANDAGKRI